jgi:hypothetical protein
MEKYYIERFLSWEQDTQEDILRFMFKEIDNEFADGEEHEKKCAEIISHLRKIAEENSRRDTNYLQYLYLAKIVGNGDWFNIMHEVEEEEEETDDSEGSDVHRRDDLGFIIDSEYMNLKYKENYKPVGFKTRMDKMREQFDFNNAKDIN